MKSVKIISGVYGYKNPVNNRIEPKACGETVEVPDAEAERLASLSVAEIIEPAPEEKMLPEQNDNKNAPKEEIVQEETEPEETERVPDVEYLETLSMSELRKIAKEKGLNTFELKSKAAIIQALTPESSPELGAEDIVV